MPQPPTRWTRLAALAALLGTAACAAPHGEEPLYVLRDQMGRSVAMAGASQLGGAAPGTVLRAQLGGVEQSLMVGERVGQGPVIGSRPVPADVAAAPAEPLPPVTELPLLSGVTSAPLDPPAATPVAGGSANRSARRATTGVSPSERRRGPPPRSISRSVM